LSQGPPPAAVPDHTLNAQEYAKIQAVLAKIDGLRKTIMGVGLAGLITSFLTFIFTANYLSEFNTGYTTHYDTQAILGYSVLTAFVIYVPFLAVMAYFSLRVNRHIERLTRGKYEPPRIIE
jgi:multisubunit Na+/H+ antiporter MnhC subunit